MAPAMSLQNFSELRIGWLVVNPMRSNQNLRVFFEASGSTRLRMAESLPTHHEDHIAGKGNNSLQHYNLVHKFIPMPQAMKNSCSKGSSGQGMEKKRRKIRRGTWRKSEVKKRWSMKQGRRAQTVHFASLMVICHLKNADLEAKHQKYKGRIVLRGDIVKDDSGSYAAFTEQGSFSISNDSSKSHGYHFQIARVRMTSSWCSICLYPSQNGGCSQIYWKFPNRNVETFGFVYHDTNGRNHGPVWKTQSLLLSEICTVILWQDCYGKGNLRKSYCSTVGRRFPIGNAYSYTVKSGYSFLCMWMTSNWLERKQNIDPMWKVLNKEIDLGEPTSFFDHVYLGCTQRQCEISQDIVDNYRAMFASRISAGRTEKLPYSDNFRISSWSYDMEGYAKNVWSDVVS